MSKVDQLSDAISDKMEEVSGMFKSIFKKKSNAGVAASGASVASANKTPKEMVETLRAFVQQLAVLQQAQFAAAQQILSPVNLQPMPMSGTASPTAGGTAAGPGSALNSQQTTPTASTSNPAGVTVSTSATALATAPASLVSPQPIGGQPNGISLTIPSPAHGGVVLLGPETGGAGGNAIPSPAIAQTPGGSILSSEAITADLDAMVTILYGDASADSANGGIAADPRLAREVIDLMFEADLFRRLLENIRYLEFEARKFFTRVFEYALTQRRELGVPYILARRQLLLQLIHAYDEKDVSIALACDAILRACIQCEPITELMLQCGQYSPAGAAAVDAPVDPAVATPASAPIQPEEDMVLPFFRYLDLPTFINSHAFATFKLLLQLYPHLGAQYLHRNYTTFFAHFNRLLASENYLTKVQSFVFLGEILIERSNQEVMMRYVNEAENLKLAMLALRGPKAIQMAVFNVLKVFVPNPYKSPAVLRILVQNKRNFLAFLDEFEKLLTEDEVLVAHKQEMAQALIDLPDEPPPPQHSARRSMADIQPPTPVNEQQQTPTALAAPPQHQQHPTTTSTDGLP